jgi:hypothetical protein
MNVPYNNGKVQIGKYYQKPQYVEQDSDMLVIQGWLIGNNKQARINYWANKAYIALLVISIIVALLT